MRGRLLAFFLGALLLLGLGLYWLYPGLLHRSYGTLFLPARPAPDFALKTAGGRIVRLSELRGRAVYLFFGYIHCPDLCPLTMLHLARLYQVLSPAERAQVQVLMITTDPERDTPELIDRYAKAFDPSFLGLSESPEVLARVAQAYGAYYEKEAGGPEGYLVAHTSGVFLVDPRGRLRLYYSSGKAAETERMLRDLRWILSGG